MEISGYSPGGIGAFPTLVPVYTMLDFTSTDNHVSLNSFVSKSKQAALITPFIPFHNLTPFTDYYTWPKAEDVQIAATPLNTNNERFLFVIASGGTEAQHNFYLNSD
ncbi:MAG: hypothetical protein IPO32_08010 [Crocinitomicaceae bacterium]|nr:hypothetical protein [Crocinitomicaceae bacterium]